MNKNKYTEEEILDEFKKLGYGVIINEYSTLILHNPTNARTIYINEDNSFVVCYPLPAAYFTIKYTTSPTFEEKRLIKKLIKVRKEKTNENN